MNLKALTIVSALGLCLNANAKNETKEVKQVTDAVEVTADVDYVITDATPFTTSGSINIVNTDHAVVIIKSLKPSVVTKQWLSHIYINGEKAIAGDLTSNNATAGSNCQVRMYDRGAIIYPYSQKMAPLTCYTENAFGGESCSTYTEGCSGGYMKTISEKELNNKIKSFKLKRGYMVTFALGTSGWGYSRCFIADHEDLEMDLPENMAGRVSSYRIFKWWNTHKAGLASNGNGNDNAKVNSSWCYDWAQGNSSNLPDQEWVPNHIYEDWPSSATCGGVDGSCNMKTNNEPANNSDDHPQSVAEVLNNWQNLMRTGMRLCSPATHDGGWGWHDEFMKAIDERGWRCDLVDFHGYWDGEWSSLDWRIDRYAYGRPVWFSEWVWGASWNNNGIFKAAPDGKDSFSAKNQQKCYEGTKPILERLNSNSRVERYAYWNGEADASKILKDGKLSTLGEYYSNMNDGLGYNADIQKIPNIVYFSPTDLKGTYTRSKGTFTLNWNDANGDMLDSLVVQVKTPGATSFKWLGKVNLKDQIGKTGASYNFETKPNEPGAFYYRIAAYPIGNKTPKCSGEVSVSISSASGTNIYQYGRLNVSNTDAINTDFTEEFSTNPAVFMGVISNKNGTLYPQNVVRSITTKKFSYQALVSSLSSTYTTSISKAEDIPFLAIQDTTNYDFGGLQCEVGNTKINMKDTLEYEFRTPFPKGVKPVVITELKFTTSPSNGICVRITEVTNKGFKAISMYEEGVGKSSSLYQTLYYLAIEPGIGLLDEENELIIAAGIGDNIYGTTYRQLPFLDGETQLYLDEPYIFGALQSFNYHSASVLRRQSDVTVTEEGSLYGAVSGTRIKRQLDATSTTTDKNNKDFADPFGWVVIANLKDGYSVPTAIVDVQTTSKDDAIYNLSGQRVTSLKKGIYIKGGKKVYIKN